MATYQAGDCINRALRLLGVLAEGETPSASESADALVALQQMIDSWNTESLAVHTTVDQVVTWPSGQASRTIGPTGQIVGSSPYPLYDAPYCVVNGVSYPIQIINQGQYDAIPVKTVRGPIPQYALVSPVDSGNTGAAWDVSVTLFPVPSQNLTIHFIAPSEIVTQPALLTSNLLLPPGYVRAFVYCLAMEIAPEFGVEPSRQVQRIAITSKRNIKRINAPDDVLALPSAILGSGGGFNIYSGD